MYRRTKPGAGFEFLRLTFPPIEISPPLEEEKSKKRKIELKTHRKASNATLHLPFIAVMWD